MMVVDATGMRFGRLTVIERAGSNKKGNAVWLCLCDCGRYTKVRGNSLRNGQTQSCGCLAKETLGNRKMTHGGTKDSLYTIWKSMKQRCDNSMNPAFKNYGGRGIAVCKEWHDYDSFRKWALQSGYSQGLEIDRVDNNGDYEPDNCRWVTRKANCNNQRRNVTISYNGRTQTATQWAEELGIKQATILWRCRHWKDAEKILFTPVNGAW